MHWYREFFSETYFVQAMVVSAKVAVGSASIAMVIGVPLSLAFARGPFRGRQVWNGFFTSPLLIPQIGIGLALLEMFTLLNLPLGLVTLILAHAVFILPFAMRAVLGSLSLLDPSLREAALDLGASPAKTFWFVTVPLIKSGLTSGFVLAAIMSFINVPLSLFLVTPSDTTLPIESLAYMESRLDPTLAAVAGFTVLVVVFINLILERVFKVRLLV
jgi:putative spermidine/putrescine transport system permease protein